MRKTTIALASMMMLALGACGAMGDKMMKKEPAGIGASECFAAGGTIDNASGSAMCKMKDGSKKPII